jgi:hypothetical protein
MQVRELSATSNSGLRNQLPWWSETVKIRFSRDHDMMPLPGGSVGLRKPEISNSFANIIAPWLLLERRKSPCLLLLSGPLLRAEQRQLTFKKHDLTVDLSWLFCRFLCGQSAAKERAHQKRPHAHGRFAEKKKLPHNYLSPTHAHNSTHTHDGGNYTHTAQLHTRTHVHTHTHTHVHNYTQQTL